MAGAGVELEAMGSSGSVGIKSGADSTFSIMSSSSSSSLLDSISISSLLMLPMLGSAEAERVWRLWGVGDEVRERAWRCSGVGA